MAKGNAKLDGPLYTPPGKSLGPHEVHGPKGGLAPGDPLGYVKHGSGGGGVRPKSRGSKKS